MCTISIIVPVYNVEKYLHCCVDSILAQTFTDIEVLLVDDGSTDSSGAICREYAHQDSRVRVFHKANGGVSSARNLGLDNATGKWIMFVDSDDKVAPEICERLLEKAMDGCLPICAYFNWVDDMVEIGAPKVEKSSYPTKEFMKLIVWLRTPWGLLFENEIIQKRNIRFDERISFGEDTLFNYDYLQFMREIAIENKPLYYYRKLPSSLSRGKFIDDFEVISKFLFYKRQKLAESLAADMKDFYDLLLQEFFFESYSAFENNMRKDAPGTLWQKIQRNNIILKSEEFKKAYAYRKTWPQYFSKRYIFMLELSYHTGSYFWLWLLGIPGKIKSFIAGKR